MTNRCHKCVSPCTLHLNIENAQHPALKHFEKTNNTYYWILVKHCLASGIKCACILKFINYFICSIFLEYCDRNHINCFDVSLLTISLGFQNDHPELYCFFIIIFFIYYITCIITNVCAIFIISMAYFSEICTETGYPQESDKFAIVTPPGADPDDLSSSIRLRPGENIILEMANTPFSFSLLDLAYTATVNNRVRITFTSESNKQELVLNVSISSHLDSHYYIWWADDMNVHFLCSLLLDLLMQLMGSVIYMMLRQSPFLWGERMQDEFVISLPQCVAQVILLYNNLIYFLLYWDQFYLLVRILSFFMTNVYIYMIGFCNG